MATLTWTNEAKRWLREIYDYIADEDEAVAFSTVTGIVSKTEILMAHPKIGHKLQQFEHDDIRMLLYGRYRIVYRNHPQSRIDILGVYHGSLDLEKHLKL